MNSFLGLPPYESKPAFDDRNFKAYVKQRYFDQLLSHKKVSFRVAIILTIMASICLILAITIKTDYYTLSFGLATVPFSIATQRSFSHYYRICKDIATFVDKALEWDEEV
ncbi:hypothetical protein [Chitinophaga sp. XS-30]|uniref:hypothetical protein n=1 Tax=Chitinophaga sp. XS-30 TaxID=2604421 RepID=UPI0011DDAF32|nr:hypothetical protein [Chitinophaga sp. XS-30]QEH43191.1 hypothetical protein FW415_20890 [Chitinophaga sp. XS-30]